MYIGWHIENKTKACAALKKNSSVDFIFEGETRKADSDFPTCDLITKDVTIG